MKYPVFSRCIHALVLTLLMSVVYLLITRPGLVNAADPVLSDDKVTVYIGKTANLELENASNDVIWRSEDEEIATVDDDGIITPVSVGATIIHATYKNVDYSCKVTVKKPYLTNTQIEVFPFEYFQLGITGTKVKKWEISDETILTVQYSTPTFRIKALAEGEAIFTIIGKDKQRYECLVIVKPCTFKASYYDKKHTKVKKISYYVDDRIAQYDSYYKGTGIKSSTRYTYDKDTYTEIQLGPGYALKSKTVYDYNNSIVSETQYNAKATLDNADAYKISEKYYDENGFYHEKEYGILHKTFEEHKNTTSLLSEVVYDKNMKKYKWVNYSFYDGMILDEGTYFPEDENVATSISYFEGRINEELYYNQNPYFRNKRISYLLSGAKTEEYYDLSNRKIRTIKYDENGNLLCDEFG